MKTFTEQLSTELDYYINRIKQKKASLIVISGGVGLGKTTLAVHICNYINQKEGLPLIKLDIKDHFQYSMGADEFKEYIDKCYMNNLPCLIYDEAGDYDKRNALTSLNKELNRLFDTSRAFNVLPILCLPSIKVLDTRMFDKGIAIIHIFINNRIENQYGGYARFSSYNLNRTSFIIKRMIELKNAPSVIAYKNVRPNFRGLFWNLNQELSTKLDELSMRGKRKVNAKIRGILNYKEIAKQLDLSRSTVKQYLSKLGIKPHDTIGREAYFNEEQIRELRNYIKKD